jgi:hypothetical protein
MAAKNIFERLEKGRPPIEKAQIVSPAQKLLDWLQRWDKPTICTREICNYGPYAVRGVGSARSIRRSPS